MTARDSAEKDAPLHRVWGVARFIHSDGFVNPSQVDYASSEEGALYKASVTGGIPVTALVTDWTRVTPPGVTEGGESL